MNIKNYFSFRTIFISLMFLAAGFCIPAVWAQEHQIEKAEIYKDVYPLISESDRYCSFFIWNKDVPELQITGAEREYEREMLSNGDTVYLNQGSSHGLEKGQVFTILKIGGESGYGETMVQKKIPGYGFIAYRKGRLRIQALGEDQATAVIEKGCGKITIGNYLVPFHPRDTVMGRDLGYDVSPFETEGIKGEVIFLQTEFNQIGSGHWGLINLGENEGLERGRQFIIYRRVQKNSPLKIVANSVVIDVQENTSTIKILSARDAVELHDQVMPHPEEE